MSSVLVGMFDTHAAAEQARTRLVAAGFSPGQVTGNAGTGSFGSADGGSIASSGGTAPVQEGFFSNFLHSIFGSDDDAQSGAHASTYKEAMRRGAFGLTVATSTAADTDRASDILEDCGAVDVDERAQQWRSEGWTGGAAAPATTPSAAFGDGLASGATAKLDVVEESLAVGKRAVARGGVRVFSRVVEVPVEESISLREEHADIQRRVVDRPATEADFAAFKEGTIEVRNTAEEVVVAKTARVVGEVEIGKTATEREEIVRDTVRRTEVDVEQIDSGTTGAKATAGAFADVVTGNSAGKTADTTMDPNVHITKKPV